MLLNELRAALGKYEAAELREMVATLYKAIPKNIKEDKGIDEILLNFSKEKAKAVSKNATVDFVGLKAEIELFMEYANNDYYFAPNRYVRKEQRSKWRFEVKRFIKALLTVGGENKEKAAQLLAGIYQMLCYACNYYIFSTEAPFSAVGYEQTELLRLTLGMLLYSGIDADIIKKAVFLTLDSTVDRETFHVSLLYTLDDVLKTPEAREMALSACIDYPKEYSAYQMSKSAFRFSASDDYRRTERGNYAVELYLILKFSLYEYDDGIRYFWENYKVREKEITLFCLLDFLCGDDTKELWLREYEAAVKRGIKPRENLQEEYAERKGKH